MYNNKRLKKITVVLVWILVITLALSTLSYIAFAEENNDAKPMTLEEQIEFMQDLLLFVEEGYVDEVDMHELLDGAFSGVFDNLDPYSVYYVSVGEGNSFSQMATGTFYGIGVSITKTSEGIQVDSFLGNSTAKTAGMKVGDIILKIDGVNVTENTVQEVADKLRGDAETKVLLEVKRDETTLSFEVKRTKVLLESATHAQLDENIGYINIANFYEGTADDCYNAYSEMLKENPKLQGLIIDLRENPGGLVGAAVETADLFLNSELPIMHYMRRDEIVLTYVSEGEKKINLPVTLLVNQNTASAAEIFAGALQDHGAAKIVGETTYGKGAAQAVYSLRNGGAMKMTIYYFLTPNESNINNVGIVPEYEVKNILSAEAVNRLSGVGALAPFVEGEKYIWGQTGLNVYGAQQRLIVLGYDQVTATATLSRESYDAIKAFQKAEGLYPYGGLDNATMKALDGAITKAIYGKQEDTQLEKAMEVLQTGR